MDNQLENRILGRIKQDQQVGAPTSDSIEGRIGSRLLERKDEERAAIQRSITISIDKDPNQLAQVNRIAKENNLSREEVEANAALYFQRQKERGILDASSRSPALARNYLDPNFAGLAKDDAESLSSISDYVGAFTSYVMGARRGGGLPQDLAAVYFRTEQASASLGRMVLEPVGQIGRTVGFQDNIFEKVAKDFAQLSTNAKNRYEKIAALPNDFWEKSARSGIQSGAQMSKYIPLAFLGPKGIAAALYMMSTEAASDTYQTDREKGVPVGRALTHASLDGVAEYTMEKYLGFAGLAKKLLAKEATTKILAFEIFKEIPGEVGTTLWQNFNEWALVNPEKSLSDFLSEQPRAIAETVVGTIFGGAVQVSAGRSSMALVETIQGRQLEATEALQRADALRKAFETAMNVKLAELSPDDFRRVVNEMGEDSPVRFDARTFTEVLNQQGITPEELESRMPTAAAQIQEAAIDNREISIPVGEFIAGVMNTPLQETLQQYARLGDSEMSQAEAKQALDTAQEFIQQESERVLKLSQDQEATRQSIDEVRAVVLDRLNKAGNFSPEVNEWYANMQATVMSVLASRVGVTPKEFFDRYDLKVESVKNVPIVGNTPEERLLDALSKVSMQFSSIDDAKVALERYKHALYQLVPGQPPKRITDVTQLDNIPLNQIRMLESGMVNDQGEVYAQSVSTRTPTAKAGREDPHLSTGLNVEFAALDQAPDFKEKLAQIVSKYMTFRKGPKKTDTIIESFITQAEENLLFLFDSVPPEIRERSKLWYDGGRRIVEFWTSKYDGKYTDSQMAAVLAVMSPKMPWDINVSLAERIIDIYTNQQDFVWDEKMSKMAAPILERNKGIQKPLEEITGKSLKEIDDPYLQGMWIRMFDEANNPRHYRLLTPEGGFSDFAETGAGNKASAAYGNGFGPIGKAVSVLRDGSMPNISRNLGEAHKVRNFYNNLFDPADDVSVTIDTHAVAAALLLPLGASSQEVADALAGPSSDATGLNGTYVLYAEAYRRAAAKRGVLPREMQSITWEAGRGLFSPAFKTKYKKDPSRFKEIWNRFTSKKADINETRKSIIEESGGIENPRWTRSDSALYEGAPASSYTTDLLGPGQFERAAGPGPRTDVAYGVPQVYGQGGVFRPGADGVQRIRASNLPIKKTFGQPRENSTAVRGVHFSRESRPSLAGRFYGTGLTGAESRRLDQSEDNRIKQRVHFYVDTGNGISPEAGVGGNVHGVELVNVYDISADPLGLIDQAQGGQDAVNSWFNQVESLALDAGFDGIYIPQAQGDQGVVVVLGDKSIDVDQLGTQAEILGGRDGLQPEGNRAGRYSSGGLTPLKGAPVIQGATGPDPRLVQVAEQYAAQNNIDLTRQAQYVEVDLERAKRIAAAYEAMQNNPQDPAVQEAYQNLINQTMAQYDALIAAGYEFTFFDSATDPYNGNPWNAMRDLRNNKRMAVYGTYDGYGETPITAEDVQNNPLLADTGLRWKDQNGVEHMVTANDLFRAVHDAFGHGLEGAGFRAQGEENAWQAHARLFTGSALAALTTETRGQNSWLNFGLYGEKNQTATVEDTVFAPQKIGLMPEWTWQEGFAPSEGRLFQRPEGGSLMGTFSPQEMLIRLTQRANLSTFLHESGHFFLEVMVDVASQPNASQSVVDDVGLLMSWFGTDLATWKTMTVDQKRKHHERFAESFEQYLFDGKAPTPELQPMFRTFSSWLKRIYKAISEIMSGNRQKLPDEIRQVYDRLLATDEQIAEAERLAGLMPNQEATDAALEELQKRSLRDLKWATNAQSKMLKKLQREAADLRKGVEKDVREEVANMPIYRAINFLKSGELRNEDGTVTKVDGSYKLSTDALESMYMGEGDRYALFDWSGLSSKKMTNAEGLHPDIVADMFGFENGDIMVRELTVAISEKEMVDSLTNQRMLEKYGDITSPEALQIAAMEAVHNEVRARALATELKAQEDALRGTAATGRTDVRGRPITVNALMQAAKLFADNVSSRTPAKMLKREIQNHRRAEARAAKDWADATKKGDTKKALQAKRDQLLNHYTVKAMQDSQRDIEKAMDLFRTIGRGSNEALVKRGRDPDVVNAARAILAEYGIAPAQGKKAAEYMELVKQYDPVMYNALRPAMDAALADAKPLDQLTVQEIRALADELGAFWYQSKRSRKMEIDGDLMDIEDAEKMLVDRMDEIGVPTAMPGETEGLSKKDERRRSLEFAKALLRRAEQWAEGMDGKYGGPFTRLIFDPIKIAANRYRQARVDVRKKYADLVKKLEPVMEAKLISAPELNYTFGKASSSNGVGMSELLHAIIHTGNDSNKRKMLLGRGWATENADGTLDTSRWDSFIDRMHREGVLKKEHYDFAQGVWDLLESMKPAAQKTHREVFGRYFDEITADQFVTPFGVYRGGYAPAQVDSRLVADAALRELFDTENENMAFSFPTTNRGFTKGRVEYNRPLLLDLRALSQHIDKVLLFTHMEPAVRDVNRLLRRNGVSKPLTRIQPAIYDGMLLPWLNRAAKQIVETPIAGDGKLTRILSVARQRAGMSLMFANISNTFQQLTGLSNAAVIVKAGNLKRATAEYIRNPRAFAERVSSASIFMNDRMKNEIAAINDAMEDILVKPTTYQRAQSWTNRHAYFMQSAFDNVIGPIVWVGAYNQAIEEGMDDNQAIKFADGAVRKTQGTTLPEDISRIESGPAYARLFTQFVGYFNMIANTNATALKNIANDTGLKKGAGKAFYVLLMGVLIPAWVAEAIALAMRGGPEDEDDDGYLDDWLSSVLGMGTLKFALAGVPIFGQVINAGINRFNSNPTDDRISASPAVSLIESSVAAPYSVYKAIVDDGSAATAVRDVSTLMSVVTGLPIRGVARPVIYGVGVMEGRIEPEGPADMIRGLLTGTASPESRVQ